MPGVPLEIVSGITSEAASRSVDCLIPMSASMQRSIASTLIHICQPIGAIFAFGLFWTGIKIWYSETWLYLLTKVGLSALVVFYISYISLTKTLINIFSCIRVYDSVTVNSDDTTDYWAVDTGITCYAGSHALLAGLVGWPLLVIFTFGFPVAVGYLIIRNVTRDHKEGWIYDVSGFLYRSYSKRFVFWESLIMLRKAILAAVVVFSYPLGANLQHVLAVFVLTLALYLQMICRPFRSEFDILNEMESASILVSSLTFISSIFFGDERVSHTVRVMVTLFVAACNIVLLLCFLGFFSAFAMSYLKIVLAIESGSWDPDLKAFGMLKIYLSNHVFGFVKDWYRSLSFRWKGNYSTRLDA